MSYLAGTGNLKPKNVGRSGNRSSDEYEESDEEAPEIFQVEKIVDHMWLHKGTVHVQAGSVRHTFDPVAMEKSNYNYAFKVRWLNFGEKDDTWEPIENFNSAMAKRLRKYCKRKHLKLPDNYRDWLLPVASAEEETSGSDFGEPVKKRSVDKIAARSPSPQPSGSRAKVDEKKEEKKRIQQLKEDLALSPSPSPTQAAKKKKKEVDALFESSEDEKEKKKVKKEGDKAKKNSTSKGTVKEERKKGGRDGSIDADERKKHKIRKIKKKEERERKNSRLSMSDGNDAKKEEDDERKKKARAELEMQEKISASLKEINRADLMQRAAAVSRQLEEEEKRRKEKKQAKIDKEKQGLLQDQAEWEKTKKGWDSTPAADIEMMEPEANETPKMSHYELEQKKKKKKLEQKIKERGFERTEDGYKKRDDWQDEIREKEERKREREERKKEKERDERRKEKYDEEGKEKRKEKEVDEDLVKIGPKSNDVRVHKRTEGRRKHNEEKEKNREMNVHVQIRQEKARKRLKLIKKRMEEFASAASEKARRQEEEWEEEEGRWRQGMYERGRWKRNGRIRDVPFSFRAEQQLTDTKCVRTVRRCTSTERLPISFRRLSSLHSMESLASQADSLAEALLEMDVGEKDRRISRLREEKEKKKKETKEKKEEKREERKDASESEDQFDLKGKAELFTSETLAMMEELAPGKATEGEIREMSQKAIDAFLALDNDALIAIMNKLESSDCVNQTVLRLARIYSPIVNVAMAAEGCSQGCDEGPHRRCRMLLTLLMALSEPHRMGDDESLSLLPPNALYEAMEVSAPCQIRAMIRGGCTFDHYYDDEGKNAAHRMMEKFSMDKLVWLIERGLDVNSAIMPKKEHHLENEFYDKPWKMVKDAHEKAAFLAQLHSQRLTARSVVWTKRVRGVGDFHLRPLTLVHTLNPHAYMHRIAAVTLCDDARKGFDRDDAVLLAVHSATIRKGAGLRATVRKSKKDVPELRIPYFLIDQATDDMTFKRREKYQCTRARLTVHNLDRPSLSETVELTRLGSNGATTVYKVPKKQANTLVSSRHFTECLLKLDSPPEYSVILAQYFKVPFKAAQGRTMD